MGKELINIEKDIRKAINKKSKLILKDLKSKYEFEFRFDIEICKDFSQQAILEIHPFFTFEKDYYSSLSRTQKKEIEKFAKKILRKDIEKIISDELNKLNS